MNEIGPQSGIIFTTIGGLFGFGIAYAAFINVLRRTGFSEGYTSILVVFGVLVTVLIHTIIHHTDPLINLMRMLVCFAASGTPMVVNDLLQYALARRKEQWAISGGQRP